MSIPKIIICIVVITVSAGCKEIKSEKKLPATLVETSIVKIDSIRAQIDIPTQIKGLNYATIQPRINGFLRSINFEGGMPVKKGDLLFTIDPSTFNTTLYAAKAALESAKAEEQLAKRNLERAEPLSRIDAISQSDLDNYRATYKAAAASTKSAKENLRMAQLEVGYTKIYSPIDGIASRSTATKGDYIGPGTLQSALTTISQSDTISVELPIPTAQYLCYMGSEDISGSFDNSSLLSNITMTLPDSTIYDHSGEYDYTLQDSPATTSTVVIVAKFPNPALKLKEGMFARVKANIGASHPCVVVPRQAVSQLQGINSVWIINADSTAQWREIELGECHDSIWVVSSGLNAGEVVVTRGGAKLHNGVKVSASAANKK